MEMLFSLRNLSAEVCFKSIPSMIGQSLCDGVTFNISVDVSPSELLAPVLITAKKNRRYYLGNHYPKLYFTTPQMRCLACFLQGMNYEETAKAINLSASTVGMHSRIMQRKLRCRNKKSLMAELLTSRKNIDFLRNLLPENIMDYIETYMVMAEIENLENR